MSDKTNKNPLENEEIPEKEILDEVENTASQTENEELTYNPDDPKYEENDNWEFEGEAKTLNGTVIENGEIEIEIPEKETTDQEETVPTVENEKEPEPKPEKKPLKKSTKYIIAGVAAAVVIALLIFFGIRYFTVPNSSEKMNPGNVALTIDGTDVSLGMYNYYYNSTVSSYKSQVEYGYIDDLDPTVDFDEQKTTNDDDEEITWTERFQLDTINQLKQLVAYYNAGIDNGEKISDDQQEEINSSLDSLKSSAEEANQSVDAYIESNYGEYCGLATIEKMLNWTYIAQNYLVKQSILLAPDEDRVKTYLDEHQEEFLQVKLAYLIMPYTDETKDEVMASAKEYAAKVKNIDDLKAAIPDACKELIDSYVDAGYFSSAEQCAEEIALEMEISVTNEEGSFPDNALEWLFSEDSKVNDCVALESDENGLALILLKMSEPSLSDETVYTVRHILIMPETDTVDTTDEETGETTTEQTEATDEQWAAAEEKANEIYEEYQSGDMTEISFAELAEEYSEDTASLSANGVYGGIYENIPESENMAEEFKNWALDKSRQYGDTGIVKTQFGYHIMYFVRSEPQYMASSRTAVLAEMADEFVDAAEVKEHKGVLKKADKALPETSDEQDADDTQDTDDSEDAE